MIRKKKKQKNLEEREGFWIGTPQGLVFLGIIGLAMMILSHKIWGENVIADEITVFVGETCFGTAILSFFLEHHTMKDYYRKVRDDLLLRNPSFVERYSEAEVDSLLEMAVKRKLLLNLHGKENQEIFNRVVDGEHFLIRPYIAQTAQALEKNFSGTD